MSPVLLKPPHLGQMGTPVLGIASSSDAGSRRPLEEEMRACPAGWNAKAVPRAGGPPLHPSAPSGKSQAWRVRFQFQLVYWLLPVTNEAPLPPRCAGGDSRDLSREKAVSNHKGVALKCYCHKCLIVTKRLLTPYEKGRKCGG